ncbi:hypothetical protein F503_06960 [Ophiostoma piceae UAMH 11346]|uniref:Uncharacterized protein n=1 Tax=Ophiostoma piceae (strain UAMH 11346) TaxID=1262450 RepID=S3C6P4_OPHP1|nr:hypothetical protein F503_06960 [Ophiostoma piceae UAMH 11346]
MSTSSSTQAAASTSSGLSNNKTLIVILSSVLSVVGVLIVAGVVFVCCRHRQRGKGFFPRGISPIDDDEIETWKGHNPPGMDEKEKSVFGNETAVDSNDIDSPPLLSVGTLGATVHRPEGPPPVQPPASRARGVSLDSANSPFSGSASRPEAPRRTPSNVIVYKEPLTAASSTPALRRPYSSGTGSSPVAATPAGVAAINYLQQQQQSTPTYRRSEEISPRSVRSLSFYGRGMVGRFSSDQDRDFLFSTPALSPLVPTALQHACAPNSRAGLTDETVPGDPSFLPTPKRQSSRLVKMPPAVGAAAAAGMSPPATAYAPRRKSNSLSGNGSHPSLVSSPSANSNSAAYWHTRTRSARSASTVSGRSRAGSDAGLTQPVGTSHQRRPSQAQKQYFGRSRPLTPPKPSPVSASGSHASLHKSLPAPPPPVSARASHSRQASQSRVSSDYNLTSRRSNSSIYRDYMNLEQHPRNVTMSPISSNASTSGGVVSATDDSDGPLLGGLTPPRTHVQDTPRAVHGRHMSSLEHAQSIGRAIG